MDYKKLAYYVAKYNYAGLVDKTVVDRRLEQEGVLREFNIILVEFRGIAYKNGFVSLNVSKNVLEIHEDNKNKTSTQLREEVNQILKEVI